MHDITLHPAPPLAVVIVNFNTGPHLQRCLESLTSHLERPYEAVVVDNASTDGSADCVGQFGDAVRLLTNRTNAGFARAVNRGVRDTHAPFVLLLNPDAQISPASVALLLYELRAQPACAVISPAVLNEDGSFQGNARGDMTLSTGLFGRTTLLSRWLPDAREARRNVIRGAEVPEGVTSVPVDWVSGACWLIRREAFERAGGFDEGYFLFFEDADLCRRLRQQGYEVRYMPSVRLTHVGGQSSLSIDARRRAIREFHRSAYRYFRAHVPSGGHVLGRCVGWLLLRLRCWMLLAGTWRAARETGALTPSGPSAARPRSLR